jgi:hypothetical protein
MQFIDIYNTLLYERNDDGAYKRVIINSINRSAYNSLRVQLVRKFNQQVKDEEAFEIDTHSDYYMACSFRTDDRNSVAGTATFELKLKIDAPKAKKSYDITTL